MTTNYYYSHFIVNKGSKISYTDISDNIMNSVVNMDKGGVNYIDLELSKGLWSVDKKTEIRIVNNITNDEDIYIVESKTAGKGLDGIFINAYLEHISYVLNSFIIEPIDFTSTSLSVILNSLIEKASSNFTSKIVLEIDSKIATNTYSFSFEKQNVYQAFMMVFNAIQARFSRAYYNTNGELVLVIESLASLKTPLKVEYGVNIETVTKEISADSIENKIWFTWGHDEDGNVRTLSKTGLTNNDYLEDTSSIERYGVNEGFYDIDADSPSTVMSIAKDYLLSKSEPTILYSASIIEQKITREEEDPLPKLIPGTPVEFSDIDLDSEIRGNSEQKIVSVKKDLLLNEVKITIGDYQKYQEKMNSREALQRLRLQAKKDRDKTKNELIKYNKELMKNTSELDRFGDNIVDILNMETIKKEQYIRDKSLIKDFDFKKVNWMGLEVDNETGFSHYTNVAGAGTWNSYSDDKSPYGVKVNRYTSFPWGVRNSLYLHLRNDIEIGKNLDNTPLPGAMAQFFFFQTFNLDKSEAAKNDYKFTLYFTIMTEHFDPDTFVPLIKVKMDDAVEKAYRSQNIVPPSDLKGLAWEFELTENEVIGKFNENTIIRHKFTFTVDPRLIDYFATDNTERVSIEAYIYNKKPADFIYKVDNPVGMFLSEASLLYGDGNLDFDKLFMSDEEKLELDLTNAFKREKAAFIPKDGDVIIEWDVNYIDGKRTGKRITLTKLMQFILNKHQDLPFSSFSE